MSQEAMVVFALEEKRREELSRKRVENKTREFYERYREQYNEMCEQGYQDYIPEEMGRLKRDLDNIGDWLSRDPFVAREVSREVGYYIHSLWGLGKEARRVFRESERIDRMEARRESAAAKNAAISRYYDIIGGLDSIVGNLVAPNLAGIQEAISSGTISTPQEVEMKLQPIIESAKVKAKEWKAQKQKEQEKQTIARQIEEIKKSVAGEKSGDSAQSKALQAKLDEIQSRAQAGTASREEVQEQIKAVTEEHDEALVDENVRGEMVRAVWKWFNDHDFSVEKPKKKDGAVIIRATKPSGKKAEFKLTLDNKMWYRLDGYEGQSCLKDIELAKKTWESVYRISFSDKAVIWENPDRILRQQGQTESNINIGGKM